MWIARDESKDLFVYEVKPIKITNYFRAKENTAYFQLPKSHFKEVTFESSPVKITSLKQVK